MEDNWGFVLGAYAFVAVILAWYWRHLVRRERALSGSAAGDPPTPPGPREPME